MSEPFIGEIMMFAGDYEPRGWKFCNGQLLKISESTALFSRIGNTYGGDGKATFGLPDYRGRAPLCVGQGANLSSVSLGEKGGAESIELTDQQIPDHTHEVRCSTTSASENSPVDAFPAKETIVTAQLWSDADPDANMHPEAIAVNGNGAGHENRAPYVALNFLIAITGVFPFSN